MFAFPDMLVGPAKAAGMAVPDDVEDYVFTEFPHFKVFETMQLGQPIPSPDVVWTNAEVIASVEGDNIFFITAQELIDLGFETGYPIP